MTYCHVHGFDWQVKLNLNEDIAEEEEEEEEEEPIPQISPPRKEPPPPKPVDTTLSSTTDNQVLRDFLSGDHCLQGVSDNHANCGFFLFI